MSITLDFQMPASLPQSLVITVVPSSVVSLIPHDSSKNRFDKNQRIAWVSKIFDWYREDFEAHGESLQAYMADYVTDPEVAALLRQQAFTIRYLDYDWNLNGSL